MKRHPSEGAKLLQSSESIDDIALDVALHHHEKTDGSGYPEGLKDNEISLYAKMGAVCDVYDAITSNRPYKAGWDPAEAPVCDYLTAIKLRKSGGLVESSDPEDLDQDLIVAGQLRTGKFG